ncbi:MAG: tetratricopeptide repeat protein [Desulfobacteraceae bacterium]|nr:tetratricopeptide repeat protein [Desulfobacteraceae bacterium]
MYRLLLILTFFIFSVSSAVAGTSAPKDLKDLYFGEALYDAFQGDWFDAISRLDTELAQHYGLDEPKRDRLYYHINQAEFAVGDFELAYRMHQRAGRAITAVIEGNVDEPARNEAIFRLARIYFQKNQPVNALYAVDRIRGAVPEKIRDNLAFLRAQILMANGRFDEAERILKDLQGAKSLEGFSTYNLGIALLKNGKELEGRQYLERTGRINSNDDLTLAIKDKSNLVLGSKMLEEKNFEGAKLVLDRVRLKGPFSNRALLGSGWAGAFQGHFERALVPWSILVTREVTDASVQEAMLAAPYAYGKLNVYSKAALLYASALEKFGIEIDKLDASIKSIREGYFLKALVREELKQDANWVVKLRKLPQTPETYYLLELMASHNFQESLKNYLDLEELRKKLETWKGDLDAFEEIIDQRRAYYQPLLPAMDREFRRLDSQMRLRLEQRDRIEQRLKAMLVVPRPDYLATIKERIISEKVALLERKLTTAGTVVPSGVEARIKRLRGVLHYNIYTDYDRRFTEAYKHLRDLNLEVDHLKKQYNAFVRTRQAATQSYEGYDDVIRRQRFLIQKAREKVGELMARQGHMLETMAVNKLTTRRERLTEFQIKARFAMADSYDRAIRAQAQEKMER